MRASGRLIIASVLDVAALALLWPRWPSVVSDLGDPGDWAARSGADEVVATLARLALWTVGVWLGIGLLALAVSRLPGALGTAGRRVGECALPAVLRRIVTGAVGLGVLAAPVAAVAGPVPTAGASLSAVVAPAWPGTTTQPGAAPLTRPDAPVPPPAWPGERTDAASAGAKPPVVVRPGDSLWVIAARRLAAGATDEQVATAWPRWYAGNRFVIGADPELIRPGQVLRAPESTHGPR